MGVDNIFRMHVVLSAGHSPRRWRRREIDRASDPVAAAALVAGTGWIGARWISREAGDCGGSGVEMVALRAARVGNDQIAGNVAGWGISEIMRRLRLWSVERKRSDAKASRRDAMRLPMSQVEGREAVGRGPLNWRDGWANPSGSSDRAEPVASRSLSFVPDCKAGAYSPFAFGFRRDREFHPFYLKGTPNCLKT